MKFDISASALLAAATFVSSEETSYYLETRYYLRGVYVHAAPSGGVICVATDGFRLAVIHDQHGIAERSAILSIDWDAKALKTGKGEAVPRRIEFDLGDKAATTPVSGRVMARRGLIKGTNDLDEGVHGGLVEVAEIDGTFPNYRRSIPYNAIGKDCAAGAFGVNASYLDDCASVFSLAGDMTTCDGRAIAISRTAPEEPLVVTHAMIPHALLVVMPMKADVVAAFPWLPVPAE